VARWTSDKKGLSISLLESTSHPIRITGWTTVSDQVVEIHVERPEAVVMSLDMRLSTTVIQAPTSLDPARPATAIIEGQVAVLPPATA